MGYPGCPVSEVGDEQAELSREEQELQQVRGREAGKWGAASSWFPS